MKLIRSLTPFEFIHQRKAYNGSITEMEPDIEQYPLSCPHIHVQVYNFEKYGISFNFYRTGQDQLFWWDFPDPFKQAMAWTIANLILRN